MAISIENSRETHYVLWENFKKYTKKFLVENKICEKNKVSIEEYKKMYDCLNEMENRDETSNIEMINYKKLQVLDGNKEVNKDKIKEYFKN